MHASADPSHDPDGGPPPAVVITGMHRSGTSLATAVLASAGLAIGERLIEAGPGNLDGHFEDRDFVEWHIRVLRGNGLGSEGYATPPGISVPAALADEARAIVADRRGRGIAWGWKDPRTTLFLDGWLERVPEARFLLLVRRPWEVVDSLYRRGDEPFRLHPAFAVDVWTAYNRRIRDFFLAHRDRCLLVEATRAVADGAGLVAVVRERLGVSLGEPAAVAKPERFRRDLEARHRDILAALRPDAIDLFEELLGLAWRMAEPAAPPADTSQVLAVAMDEWASAARGEAAASELGQSVMASHAALECARARQSVASVALDGSRGDRPDSDPPVGDDAPVNPPPDGPADVPSHPAAPASPPGPRGEPLPLARRLLRESRRLCRQARGAVLGPHPRSRSIAPTDSARSRLNTGGRPVRPLPAILGGEPLFPLPRHVGAPHLPDRGALHASLDAILDSRRLSNDGPFVRRLEAALAAEAGCRHAIALCNATLALQLVFRASRLEGEVIMPAFTFVATAHAATWESLEPVFVDIDPRTHCIDPAAVAAALTPRTAAIVGVHVWGNLCDVAALAEVADASGIPLFFDAAHALGCSGHVGPLGGLGQASVVSLHATKVVSGLEGGAVLTNDDALADSLRTMRNFGFMGYDRVDSLGTNAKMNEFSAAFALAGLADLPHLVVRNAAVMAAYRRGFADAPGIRLVEPDPRDRSNHHYVVAVVGETCPLERDEIHRALEAENVLARRYFYPGCHRMMPYAGRPAGRATLAVTERVCSEVLVLPAGGSVTDDEAEAIAHRIRLACGYAATIRQRQREGIRTSIRPAA